MLPGANVDPERRMLPEVSLVIGWLLTEAIGAGLALPSFVSPFELVSVPPSLVPSFVPVRPPLVPPFKPLFVLPPLPPFEPPLPAPLVPPLVPSFGS